MDFSKAADKLSRDQSKLRRRQTTAPALSAKAKREAELRKKQQERMADERRKKQREAQAVEQLMRRCERNLGVKAVSTALSRKGTGTDSTSPLRFVLEATSIHGQGDKIALPVSVLEFLTSAGIAMNPDSPWIFRVAIPNPHYQFPASTLWQQAAVSFLEEEDGDDVYAMNDGDDDDDDDDDDDAMREAFLDELSHKYLAYTHASVVEFTQEEGHVGLPATTAAALHEQGSDVVPMHRTVDPAGLTDTDSQAKGQEMEKDVETTQTPGHLAWGAFDVPHVPVEVSLVQLPKGQACTLCPTTEAIHNGFYNLKDIKLVLEQSLIRSRATLSVNDIVHTWHRGVKYDLRCQSVKPSTYRAVVCINTDITVDFVAPPSSEAKSTYETDRLAASSDQGRTLGSAQGSDTGGGRQPPKGPTLPGASPSVPTEAASSTMEVDLLPEPPVDQKENICTIQIRGDGANGRRRFDIHQATTHDLFLFAGTVVGQPNFRLVSRFPRRIFHCEQVDSSTLARAGLSSGQELLMVERL
jgi:hypothetical protein